MKKTNRAHASTPDTTARRQREHGMPAAVSWPRLVSMGVLAGAARHAGSLLVGLAVAWWHHD
ncbi:hypothetical protein OH768_54040 [Streptomyces sp. NBC_01622]|uniref:hypothetical protein n=1 Tax=Streptomyces sp. NBC_01622 TaxID=2975903 RepID=UPI00386BE940|nr:hypothetical protein OH768_00120 [Streptomyces sp. NBC_01622]WTE48679.1 hypothetical protein OH768_54040 [Streptomyces sp. NBC_01622]